MRLPGRRNAIESKGDTIVKVGKLKSLARSMAALAVGTILSSGFGAPSFAASDRAQALLTATPIKHLIVIFQENVSFDHYFGTYPQAANVDGTTFTALPDTPVPNNLLGGGLLTNNPNSKQPVRLRHTDVFTCDENHSYTGEQKAFNNGLMDKFVEFVSTTGNGAPSGLGCATDGSTDMGYYDGNTVTAIWNYAQNFAMSDNFFNTTFGPSTPGAINVVSGQTHGAQVFTRTGGTALGAPVPVTMTPGTGVASTFVDQDGLGSVVSDPDPLLDDCANFGNAQSPKQVVQMSPSNKNIGDLLNANATPVSWGWFGGGFRPTVQAASDGKGGFTSAAVCGAFSFFPASTPNPVINNPLKLDLHTTPIPDYVPHHQSFMYYASTSNPHHLSPTSTAMIGVQGDQANHIYDLQDFFTALSTHNLPAVTYIKAKTFQDAHPANSTPLDEQAFIVTLINTVMQSPEWASTAIIITYDDSDGWYDHVMGPIVIRSNTSGATSPVDALSGATPTSSTASGMCGTPAFGAFPSANGYSGRCGHGPRVPLLVISPFSKANYVDHTVTDQSSVVKFIEDNWLNGTRIDTDAFAQANPGKVSYDRLAGSLLNLFDFTHPKIRRMTLDATSGAVLVP